MKDVKEKFVALDELMPLFKESLSRGQTVKFSPRGISMLPLIREGKDSVTLSSITRPLRKYDIALYQRDNGKYILHRIIHVGKTYTCMGDNQFVKETGVRHDQMIGLVTTFTRGEKTISVEDWRYRLYCRVWAVTRFPRYCWKKGKSLLRRLFK